MAVLRWVVALVFLFAMVIFGSQNMEPVTVNYYFGSLEIPMFLLMAVLILIGAFMTALVGLADQLRLQARSRGHARRVQALEKEIEILRGGRPMEAREESRRERRDGA